MKKLTFVYLILALFPMIISCKAESFCVKPTGKVVTANIDVKNFDEINFDLPGKLILTQGNDYSLKIETTQNLQDVIQVSVKDNQLFITTDKNICLNKEDQLVVYLQCPNIKALTTLGSGDIFAQNSLKVSNLTLSTHGSGDISIPKLTAEGSLECSTAGSGDIIIANSDVAVSVTNSTAGSGDIKITKITTPILKNSTAGSGDIKIEDIENGKIINCKVAGSGDIFVTSGNAISISKISIAGSGDVKVMVPSDAVQVKNVGSGDAWVNAQKSLDVKIVGSGDVHFKGSPQISKSILGSGDLIKMK